MPYYVVNVGRGRATHIMKSSSASIPGMASQVITGYAKSTLCGLTASRYVNVFTPSEASCRECKKRWQLAVTADAAKAAKAPQRAPSSARKASPLAAIAVLLVLVVAAAGSSLESSWPSARQTVTTGSRRKGCWLAFRAAPRTMPQER